MKLIVLDRDGVINHDSDQFIKSPEEWKPIAGSLEAIARLNQLSPQYLGGLTLETINTNNAKVATDKYIESLLKKAQIEAATQNLVESQKKIQQLQAGQGEEAGFFQTTAKVFTSKTADGYSSAKKEIGRAHV